MFDPNIVGEIMRELALRAMPLVVLWTDVKVNKRTWEMLQFYLNGWASLEELESHIAMQKAKQELAASKKQTKTLC